VKRLYLLRHAKSSWDDEALSDHARPLSPRGRRAAPAIAARLRTLDLVPDQITASTSVRTRETVQLVLDHFDTPEVEFLSELYLASTRTLLETVRETDDQVEGLMLVGHNPGMHDLACRLLGEADSGAEERLQHKFPTAAVAVFEVRTDSWSAVEYGALALEQFIRPKDLAEADWLGL